LTQIIKDLGLFDVRGRDKSIPDIYMRASIVDRVSLLQGLIDSDGHVHNAKNASTGASFTSTSYELSSQLRLLVRGLGGVAGCKQEVRISEPDRRPQWGVHLNKLPEWIVPIRLSRKRAAWRSSPCWRGQGISKVELIGCKLAQCIKVNADDGLYVTDDFIVTHNTPNLVIKGIPAVNKTEFDRLVAMMEDNHAGVRNAYKTLYLTAGADATVVGADLKQMDFKAVQGGGETRIALLSRVPAPLLGIAEGLAGSSLNAGNFGMARRIFADSWIYPTLQDIASTLSTIMNVPSDAELWFDTADMPLLREDARDAADIEGIKATTICKYVQDGFTPESAVAAVIGQNVNLLKHTGLVSVQLLPPGMGSPTNPNPEQIPAAGTN
jgi:hypothetical protein